MACLFLFRDEADDAFLSSSTSIRLVINEDGSIYFLSSMKLVHAIFLFYWLDEINYYDFLLQV
jgi:hypothetical protein